MIESKIQVVNKLGLHARAASKLVKLSAAYESDIKIGVNGQEVDAKSIMGVLMLAATKGTEVTLKANGRDEGEASQAISELFADYFGEGE